MLHLLDEVDAMRELQLANTKLEREKAAALEKIQDLEMDVSRLKLDALNKGMEPSGSSGTQISTIEKLSKHVQRLSNSLP